VLGGFELRYLAAVAGGADFPVAARTIPSIVRGMAARRARRRVSEVMLASSHADDVRHVHRVAYLRAIDREPPNHDDKAAIERAFTEHRSEARERRAPLVLAGSALGIAAVIALGGVGYRLATRPAPRVVLPSTTADVPLPTAAAADQAEEAPAHPLDRVLREALPEWVIALDAESAGRPREAPRDVAGRHADVLTALAAAHASEDLATSFRTLLEVSERYSREDFPDGEAEITRALVAVDDALARAEAPYYVDGVVVQIWSATPRRRVLMSTFRVRDRHVFASGERRITALDLDRIDPLSFERTLLGYTRPDVRYGLVLAARVEDYLVTEALPAMHAAEESVIVRGYEDEPDASWVTPFETAVHEILREEASRLASPESVRALAAAVARRRRAFESFSTELEDQGMRLSSPGTYHYDLLAVSGALGSVDTNTRQEVREAQSALQAAGLEATYRAIESAELLSIARHEAQHRVDYEDDRLVAVPDALAAYTGRTESEDQVNRLAERSNAELSAYLSQVAREPERARSHLVQISRFVMNRDAWGMPESYAALVIFETLARELGISHGALVVARRIQRGELAAIFLAARGRSGAEIAGAASRSWSELYGVELPPLEPLP